MASRIAKKPDPQIKKNVLRARESARKAKHAHASVVVSSLVATLLAWAMFSNQDTQALEAARQASNNQAQTSITAPAESAPASQTNAPQIADRTERQPIFSITTR